MKPTPERAIDRVQERASRGRWSVGATFDKRVRKLVRDWGTQKSPALIEEMITTALKIARDEMTVADLKLINRSAKEMRSAAKIFAPFKHLRKVVVFGSARSSSDSPDYKMATDFACEMVRRDFMLIAGGSDGIMGAVQHGAGRATVLHLVFACPRSASRRTHRGRSQARDTELLLYSQIEFRERGARVRAVARRLWDDG